MMKRKYIVPEVELTRVDIESALLSESNPNAEGDNDYAKEHNPIFGFWDEEEEESSVPRIKSVWED